MQAWNSPPRLHKKTYFVLKFAPRPFGRGLIVHMEVNYETTRCGEARVLPDIK
jgi:hypothetical protein